MRHDISCGPMSCIPTRKDHMCSDTIREITSAVISLIVSLYTTAQQYRGLMTNSGMPSFLVGTQDMDHMRYHNVSFMSQSCLHFLFIQFL